MGELLRKECGCCKQEKYLYEFNRSKASHDGIARYCRDCAGQKTRDWAERTKPRNVEKTTWKNDFRNWG